MRQILYVDTYFFINFMMDLTSLFITGLILSEKARLPRCLLAALFGGAIAVFPVVFSLPYGGAVPLALLSFPGMIGIAFGRKPWRRFFFLCLFCFLTCLFLGGAIEAIYYYAGKFGSAHRITLVVFLIVVSFGATAWNLWGKSMKRKMDTRVISLVILFGKKSLDLYGLVDSGSLLCEPISGQPVILLKAAFADSLLSPEEMKSLQEGTPTSTFPLYAIPMRTASGSQLLFGFRPDGVKLHHKAFRKKYKEIKRVVIALDFSDGGFAGCPALVPLSIV